MDRWVFFCFVHPVDQSTKRYQNAKTSARPRLHWHCNHRVVDVLGENPTCLVLSACRATQPTMVRSSCNWSYLWSDHPFSKKSLTFANEGNSTQSHLQLQSTTKWTINRSIHVRTFFYVSSTWTNSLLHLNPLVIHHIGHPHQGQ